MTAETYAPGTVLVLDLEDQRDDLRLRLAGLAEALRRTEEQLARVLRERAELVYTVETLRRSVERERESCATALRALGAAEAQRALVQGELDAAAQRQRERELACATLEGAIRQTLDDAGPRMRGRDDWLVLALACLGEGGVPEGLQDQIEKLLSEG